MRGVHQSAIKSPPSRPGTRRFDVFFDLRLNKRLSKHGGAGGLRRHHAHYVATVMDKLRAHCIYKMVCINNTNDMTCNDGVINLLAKYMFHLDQMKRKHTKQEHVGLSQDLTRIF